MTYSETMASLGIALPEVAKPVGSYVPAVQTGSLVVTSGQLPMREGSLVCTGKVGSDCTLEQAVDAAGVAAINALAAVAGVVGGVDRIERIVRVGVFVNSEPGFTDQPKVANGASDLLARIFGDAGTHARAAVGVSELPLNAAVELELMAQVAS
jgi:enamine deaminase RidA (YjgF/YER057c/UK114 family)